VAGGGRRWPEGVVAVGATEEERPPERDSDRERREMEGARAWWLHWPEVVAGGRRWSTVAGGCGGSGCSGEREAAEKERGIAEAGEGRKKGS